MLKFNSDGKFTIMQISDAQDLPLVRKSLVQMINRACDILHPDLVLFTGDNILGNHINDAVIGTRQVASGHDATRKRVERAISHIILPLEARRIPFAVLYGNHDDMNCIENPSSRKYTAAIHRASEAAQMSARDAELMISR